VYLKQRYLTLDLATPIPLTIILFVTERYPTVKVNPLSRLFCK